MDAKLAQGWTVALVLWGVIGPIVGILFGHLLSRSWQREQWFRDKRHDDYQAVLSAVSSAYMAIVRLDKASTTSHYVPEMVQEVEVIKVDAFRVLRDRIFIAQELEFANVLVEWDAAVTNFEMRNSDERTFADRFSKLNAKLVGMALHPPKNPGRFRRWRMRRELTNYEHGKL